MLILSGNFAFSQSIVSGKVMDSLQNPIPFANVIVKVPNQEGIVTYTTTEENGHFEFSIDEEGSYEVTASSISFQKKTELLSLGKNRNYKLDFILKEEAFTLDEVILHSERAITVKEDTIIFRAEAFKRGNESTVEDLLKNIPGISVDRDGKIKVGDKEIEKVMIEGDDLFEKGYSMLTKNLDASVIKTIEVYERYSNNRLLKGVENSDRVALNLTLKDDVKNQLFGVLKFGYGPVNTDRYDIGVNTISFRKKNKLYSFFNYNNIGTKTTTALSEMMRSSDENIGSFANEKTAEPLMSLVGYKPDIGEERINFNSDKMASLNDIYTINSKTKIKLASFLNWDENDFFRKSEAFYFLPTDNFNTTEVYELHDRYFSGFAHTQLTHDISETAILEYSGKYSGNRLKTNTTLLFNEDPSNEFLKENPFTTHQKLKYSNKLQENQVLILNGFYLNSSNPQKYTNSRFLFEDLFENRQQIHGVTQEGKSAVQVINIDADLFIKNKNDNLWKLNAGTNLTNERLVSNFGLLGADENPQGFQNNLKYKQFIAYVEPSYHFKLGPISFTGNLQLVQNFTKFKSESSDLSSFTLFINPKISVVWEVNNTNRFLSFFRFEERNPNLQNLQNGYRLTRYNHFTKGIENIESLKTSTLFLNYTLGNILTTFYANTSFLYIKNHDYLGSNSIITQDFSLNELMRLKNKEYYSLKTDANVYMKPLALNLKILLGYNSQKYENIVNGSFRKINFTTFRYGAEIKSAFYGPFNFHVGTEWFNSSYRTIPKYRNTRSRSFLDIIYQPMETLTLTLNTSQYYFSDLDQKNNTYYFMDFESKYQVIEGKLSLSLIGKNLLNIDTFREASISDIGNFTTEYKLLPRFFLLRAEFRF